MKKFLTILLAVCLCISMLALTACSEKPATDKPNTNTDSNAPAASDGAADAAEENVPNEEAVDENVDYTFGVIDTIADTGWTLVLYSYDGVGDFRTVMVEENLTAEKAQVNPADYTMVYSRTGDENWTEAASSDAEVGDGVILSTMEDGTKVLFIVK